MAKAMTADEKRWEAEDDARSMERAAEVSNNPERMKAAQKIINERKAALNALDEMFGKSMPEKK